MAPSNPILQMFGHTPIRPLQTHMEKAYSCAELLLPFFQMVIAGDWDRVKATQQEIAKLESEADELKKDLRMHLPRSLFLPVPRMDLLQTLILQDQLPNKAKDIAGLVLGRKIAFPAAVTQPFMDFLKRCLDAAKQAHKAIDELDELLETGFRGNEVKIVENMIVELDRIEHATDEMQIQIRSKLFQLENTLSPVDVVFLYKIIEWTGDLADISHNIGEQLCILLAR